MARAIEREARGGEDGYILMSHDAMDICSGESIEEVLSRERVDVVINCAAYTIVDGAEDDEVRATGINGHAVERLAKVCRRRGIRLIHISTDYVYGGDCERTTPYREGDDIAPINAYGRSKAVGERGVVEHGGIVVRTSWLYAPWGKNFVLTILRLAGEHKELSVVDDQRGVPTSALGLARMLVGVVASGAVETMGGIYHYCDGGETTWHGFAQEIVTMAGIEGCTVKACSTAERNMRAKRPAYSVLNTERIASIEGVEIAPWQERLKEVITIIKQR